MKAEVKELNVRCTKFRLKLFLIYFSNLFYFCLFFILESRVRVRVISQLHCHTSVTSDDTVTIIVIKKDKRF